MTSPEETAVSPAEPAEPASSSSKPNRKQLRCSDMSAEGPEDSGARSSVQDPGADKVDEETGINLDTNVPEMHDQDNDKAVTATATETNESAYGSGSTTRGEQGKPIVVAPRPGRPTPKSHPPRFKVVPARPGHQVSKRHLEFLQSGYKRKRGGGSSGGDHTQKAGTSGKWWWW